VIYLFYILICNDEYYGSMVVVLNRQKIARRREIEGDFSLLVFLFQNRRYRAINLNKQKRNIIHGHLCTSKSKRSQIN